KKIDNYIALDKLRLHEPKEIELLWRARFANQETALCAVIQGDTYKTLYRNARHHPMFVLPLFRPGQGVEMQFCQWTFPDGETAHLILTSLLEYKTRGEYARPHTIIEHHAELLEEKGLVLMKGDLTDSRALNGLQATWMLTLLQRFYCVDVDSTDQGSQRRRSMLQDFTAGKAFDVDALIEE
ncbi:ATP11 protein-domain-containing protein, partial [Protomyces lactucae-debilis]